MGFTFATEKYANSLPGSFFLFECPPRGRGESFLDYPVLSARVKRMHVDDLKSNCKDCTSRDKRFACSMWHMSSRIHLTDCVMGERKARQTLISKKVKEKYPRFENINIFFLIFVQY
ncbi:hypothetical protein CEXT_109851 [Caerostris extrusa]|uniref:Uncharacterized protein n=1 Tax=Caerostris extrusa TaxID=172846 RepID=A0AAV4XDM6_CAEEX|nr:hypothetical protein CEXT_109851 [Caerostris extrusa]